MQFESIKNVKGAALRWQQVFVVVNSIFYKDYHSWCSHFVMFRVSPIHSSSHYTLGQYHNPQGAPTLTINNNAPLCSNQIHYPAPQTTLFYTI